MRAAESRRTNDLGDSDFPDSFFRNDDLPPGRIHHGWHFGEIGRLFIPVITLKSVTGLTLGKTLLAIDRTFAGGLEGNFTIFMAVRANRFMHLSRPAKTSTTEAAETAAASTKATASARETAKRAATTITASKQTHS